MLATLTTALMALAPTSAQITAIDVPVFNGGETAEITVYLENTGDFEDAFLVEVESITGDYDASPSWQGLSLEAGATGSVVFDITPGDLGGAGAIEFGLYIDDFGPFNTFIESQTAALDAPPDAPDLTVASLTLTPAEPTLGEQVVVTATIANIGTKDIQDFLCAGGDIPVHFTVNDELMPVQQLSCGLDAGDTDQETVSFVVDSLDEYAVTATVDPADEWDEVDETNNSAALTVTPLDSAVIVTPKVPDTAAPGLKEMTVGVDVSHPGKGVLNDVYVAMEIVGKTGYLDIGPPQGEDIASGETVRYDAEIDLGSSVADAPYPPGDYTVRYQVWTGGMPGVPSALPLSDALETTLTIVPTVSVTDDNLVVPAIDPAIDAVGPVWSWDLPRVAVDDTLVDVTFGFVEPVDPTRDGTWHVLERIAFLDVVDSESGAPICDGELRLRALRGALIWRELISQHSWYEGTHLALQEGYDWYYDEKHLKFLFYFTQPFVIAADLIEDASKLGSELVDWVKVKLLLGDSPEDDAKAEVGLLAFNTTMVMTKSYDTLTEATQTIIKLHPIFAGENYVSDTVISERLFEALEAGGDDLESAIDLVHEVLKEEAPEDYTRLSQILTPSLILGAIGNTLVEGVQEVLWQGIKRGATAYFINQLTARTAWKIVLGEGKATLLGGLTKAGIAKGIASFGLTLLITFEVAYFTYVGTFLDNIRGPGGLIESGRVVAQSIPWTHLVYRPDAPDTTLDVDEVEDTVLAHAVMFEIYGFIHSDLAMLKRLAFAKSQSKELLERTESLFGVTQDQRLMLAGIDASVDLAVSPACGQSDEIPTTRRDLVVTIPGRTERTRVSDRSGWAKQDDYASISPEAPTFGKAPWWTENSAPTAPVTSTNVAQTSNDGGCSAGTGDPHSSGSGWVVLGLLSAWLLRRRRSALAVGLALALLVGCGEEDPVNSVAATTSSDSTDGSTATDQSTGTDGVDGADGTDGTDGADGTAGTTNTDATTGTEGTDETDGTTSTDTTDGTDGTDGTDTCFCDDGNPCTIDDCLPDGGCDYLPAATEDCKPSLEIFAPARGVTHETDAPFEMSGKATTAAAAAAKVEVGAFEPPVNDDGTFFAQVFPDHGINIVTVVARDEVGNQATETRGILAGTQFYDTTNGATDDALVTQAFGAWLGKAVWDDDDTSDLDDFATIASVILGTIDIESLLPDSITGEGEGVDFAWCTWTIDVSNIQWTVGPVDLDPVMGGLALSATLTNLSADVSAVAPETLCPDAIGTVTIATISVQAELAISLGDLGQVLADVPTINVEIVEPVVDLTGGALSLLDFVFNWFNDTFANLIEGAIEGGVKGLLAPTIQNALESFTVFETTFQLPDIPVLGSTPALTIGVKPDALMFDTKGANISLAARVTTEGGVPDGITSPGSLARGDCMVGQAQPVLELPNTVPVALGLHDDLLNQMLFAGWWSGALHTDIPGQVITDRLGFDQFDISTVSINPLLPPVVTSCGSDGKLTLQVGDLGAEIELSLSDQPGTVAAYVSAAVDIQLSAVEGDTPGTLNLAVTVTDISTLAFDIVSATGSLDGSEQVVALVLGEVVGSLVDDAIGNGLGANFPVPSLDLGTLIPGVPEGSVIGFAPAELATGSGYTMLSGSLSSPTDVPTPTTPAEP